MYTEANYPYPAAPAAYLRHAVSAPCGDVVVAVGHVVVAVGDVGLAVGDVVVAVGGRKGAH